MHHRLTALFLFAFVLALGCRSSQDVAAEGGPTSQAPPGFWGHWGDGKAELAGYRLTQPRYGEDRTGEAILITVTEDFTRAARVKSDGGHFDEFPVVKLNEVRDWTTGLYDYNVMTSVFLPLDGSLPRGLPTKISFSSQEWCGQIWEQLRINGSAAGRTMHSYFDGEADQHESIPIPEGGVFADAMPLLVRGLVGDMLQPGESTAVPWMRSALDRRLLHENSLWGRAELQRSEASSTMDVPAGSFEVETWTVQDPTGTSSWYVEQAAPHRLIGWSRSNGERGDLTGSIRSPYWKQNKGGDEALRLQLGLN